MRKYNFILIWILFTINFLYPQKDITESLERRFPYVNYIFSQDSLLGFNENTYHAAALNNNCVGFEYKMFMYKSKREFIKHKYGLHTEQSFDIFGTTAKNTPPQMTPNSAPCNNEDFELGNFTGWSVNVGTNTSSSCTQAGCCSGGFGLVQIFNAPGADLYGNMGTIPASPLGGSKVALLNDNTAGGKAVRIRQTFPVTNNNSLFQFAFMAALQNAGHTCCEQPYALVQLLNCSNSPLPCPTFSITAPTSGCPTVYSGWSNASGYTYTNSWIVSSIDLTPYIGSCVTIEVTVGDCTQLGHWGYLYFDALCTPMYVTVDGTNFPVGTTAANVPICGATTGTISAPNFLAPYTWSGPPGSGISNYSGQTFTTSTAGVYTITMNPPNACAPITRTVNIQFVPNPNATFLTNNICNTYTLINTGDPPPSVQTYSFAGPSAPASFTTLATNTTIVMPTAGTYTIYHTVTNTNSCSATQTLQLTVPSIPTVAVNSTSATCTSGGSGTVNISGGTAPFNYTWSPSGGNAATASNLPQGNYTITVSDNNGCTGTGTTVINVPPTLTATAVQIKSVTCKGGANGSATVTIAGGTPAFTYLWSNSNTTSNPTGLSAGFYTVTVKDVNNCQSTSTVQIVEPPALSITVSSSSISCNGGTNGTTSSNVSGGVGGYTYTWTPSGGNSANATGLSANTYTVNVADANGCTISANTVVVQPPALSITVSSSSVSCNGGSNGSASANVSGGVGGYTYAWVPSGGNNANATGLPANTYTVNVADANGCTISASTVITQPSALTITATSTNVSCFGFLDGATSSTVTGGMGGYIYAWTPSGGNASSANGLGPATYTITATDVNGCVTSTNITVTQPSSVSLVTSPNATICFGQNSNVFANASGGSAPYTYTWTPSTLAGAGPIVVTPTTTSLYNVYATDSHGCLSPTKTIQIYVHPPLQATGMFATVCDKVAGTLTAALTSPGNGGPYSYFWSNGATTPSITVTGNYSLTPQTYTVTIDDGCTIPTAVAVSTLYVNPLPKGYFTGDLLQGCMPLHVNFTAVSSGGSTDSYIWSFGNGQSGTGNPTSSNYPNPGTYSVGLQITNQYGCKMDTFALNYIHVYPYPSADFQADPWNGSIINPNINFINTSVGATSYTWNFGDYSSPTNTTSITNPNHEYLYSGTYSVTLIAINQYGCEDRITKTIYIDPEFHIYIPNVFTPDGNGLNDEFQPKGVGIDENNYKLLIFDRWGEMIYESNNFRKGWDGTVKGKPNKATQDVYIYKIYVKDIKGGKHEFVGHVTCLPDYK